MPITEEFPLKLIEIPIDSHLNSHFQGLSQKNNHKDLRRKPYSDTVLHHGFQLANFTRQLYVIKQQSKIP